LLNFCFLVGPLPPGPKPDPEPDSAPDPDPAPNREVSEAARCLLLLLLTGLGPLSPPSISWIVLLASLK
jgi:hypothetical protein